MRGELERWLPRMVEEGVPRGCAEKTWCKIYRLGRAKARSGRRTRPLLDLLDARLQFNSCHTRGSNAVMCLSSRRVHTRLLGVPLFIILSGTPALPFHPSPLDGQHSVRASHNQCNSWLITASASSSNVFRRYHSLHDVPMSHAHSNPVYLEELQNITPNLFNRAFPSKSNIINMSLSDGQIVLTKGSARRRQT